jgi:hypothetical protein
MLCSGVPPRAAAIRCRLPRTQFVQSSFPQIPGSSKGPLPSSPEQTAQFTSEPSVQFFKDFFRFRQPEVLHPTTQERVQIFDDLCQAAAFPFAKAHPHFVLQSLDRGSRHSQPWLFIPRHRVTQKLSLPWSGHRALFEINLQAEPLFKEYRHRCHHSFSGLR